MALPLRFAPVSVPDFGFTMNTNNAGFTALEAMIAITFLGALMVGFLQAFSGFQALEQRSEAAYNAAVEANDAMKTLRHDLTRSGFVLVNGMDFPATYPAGEPPIGLESFGHPEPNPMLAADGEEAELEDGANAEIQQEVAVVLPLDADGDNWPDLDAAGLPIWDPDVIGYQLVPLPDGTNDLVRVRESGSIVTLAHRVSTFLVESPADTGFAIPLDCLRIRLAVQRLAENGDVHVHEVQELVRLPNGGLGV